MHVIAIRITLGLMVLSLAACGTQQTRQSASAKETAAVVKPAPKNPEITEEEDLQVLSAPVEADPIVAEKMEKMEHDSGKVEKAAAKSSGPKLAIPTAPNTWLVTVEPKNFNHFAYGVGDKRGFAINGESGKSLVVERGKTYTFQVRTGVQHDFYFSTNPKGWGASVYRDGVEGQFTYKRDVSFKPSKKTPDTLYYGCRNHNSMGGKIVVVNTAGEKKASLSKLAEEHKAMLAKRTSQAASGVKVTPAKVKQKIAYVDMMLKFKGKGLAAAQKAAISQDLTAARDAMTKGDNATALTLASKAADGFKQKAKSSGPTAEELADQKAEYIGRYETLKAFVESHHASFDAALAGKTPGVKPIDYDRKHVSAEMVKAEKLVKAKKYPQATKIIAQAEREVTLALNQMLGSQTIVYELKFDTPKDEFDYEVKRYHSYLELIPVAIDVKKPKPGSIKLMEMFKKKGAFFEGKSQESAKAGRWDEALVVIKDATKEVRRGLMSLGVTM